MENDITNLISAPLIQLGQSEFSVGEVLAAFTIFAIAAAVTGISIAWRNGKRRVANEAAALEVAGRFHAT